MTLPPAEPLSFTGMAIVLLFGLWKMRVAPILARRRLAASA